MSSHFKKHRLAVNAVCLGVLMVVLDTTIVVTALPSIVADLGLSHATLTWLVNAYLLTFGGCLLISGRLADVYGQRLVFLWGIALFTLGSLTCGWAHTPAALLAGRALQGTAGAAVSCASLSLITKLFPEPAERAGALGLYGTVSAAGGGIGVVLGGMLIKVLNWHWIFLLNAPIGALVCVLCLALIPADRPAPRSPRHLNLPGAALIMVAIPLFVYTIDNGNESGWKSPWTQVLSTTLVAISALFFFIESRTRQPILPARLFYTSNFTIANSLCLLWAAAAYSWFVISALYLQRVLGYSPWQIGFALLPAQLAIALFSAGLAARTVARFGIKLPIAIGFLLATIGLLLFARAPTDGQYIKDILPGTLLIGLAAGVTTTPMLLAAMNGIDPADSGIASGIANTCYMIGGAIGIALLTSHADHHTFALHRSGMTAITALNLGYHYAFASGAALTALAAVLSTVLLRSEHLTREKLSKAVLEASY